MTDGSYVTADTPITQAGFGQAWCIEDGQIRASVRLGEARLMFASAQTARDTAAACLKAAEALDELDSEGHASVPAGEGAPGA